MNSLGLYDASMAVSPYGGIVVVPYVPGIPSPRYLAKPGRGHKPVNFVNWFSAVRFANWMHNGQGSGSTESGAYTLLGGGPVPTNLVTRDANAIVFLSSEAEWYKAAYYDGDSATWFWFPTRTSDLPVCAVPSALWSRANCAFAVNSPTDVGAYADSGSPYGSFDQGGNLVEWTRWSAPRGNLP